MCLSRRRGHSKKIEKLDKLLLEDIKEGPEIESPEVNKIVHNQSKAIASAPNEQTTLVNLIYVLIDPFIVIVLVLTIFY